MKEYIFDFSQPVGDPMVEIGRLGLMEYCGKDNFESLDSLKDEVSKVFGDYIYAGAKRINQVFSSNSKFTNHSLVKNFKSDKSKKDARLKFAKELYSTLLNESKDGFCLACGKKDNLCSVSKTILPLTTGNSNVNFTSNFSNQFLVCKECMTSLFFAPMNMQKVAGKMSFVLSDNIEINQYWSEENSHLFKSNIAKNLDSLVDSKTAYFENFIYEKIEEFQKREELFGNMTFYLFSNVDGDSEINIIYINQCQMQFIHKVAPKFFKNALPSSDKDEWNYLVFKYAYKERTIDKKTIKFGQEVIKNKNYKATLKYFNPLLVKFVRGESLLGLFKKSRVSWNLTKIYLKEIRNMREERLEVLKNVADKLQRLNDDEKSFVRKVVFPLEKTRSQDEFREKLRDLMKKFLVKLGEPLFTADEMVFQILPTGESWRETKDILLIAIYEKIALDHLDDETKEELERITTIEGEKEYE